MSACRAWTGSRPAGGWCEASGAKVVVLTTFDLDEHLFAAIRAGASGFLLKASPPEDLVAAIHAADAGNALVEPRMTKRLLEEFARRPALVPSRPDPRPFRRA